MRILVTGGAGFIGSHVGDALIGAGHEVAIVDSFWSQGGGRRANLNPKAQVFEVDIRDAGLADVFSKFRPEIVSHHAAQHSVAISTQEPLYGTATSTDRVRIQMAKQASSLFLAGTF